VKRPLLLLALLAGGVSPVLGADAPPAVGVTDGARVERGRAAFVHRCGMCHREGGTGTFILARRLGKEQSMLEQRTNLQPEYIRYVVRWGFVNMPRMSRVELPDADLDAVVDYLTARNPK